MYARFTTKYRLLGGFVAVFACLPFGGTLADEHASLRVDGERLNATLQHLRTFGENENGGSDRVAYSDHNRLALSYLSSLMLESGLAPRIDVAGNLVGRRNGTDATLAPLVTGSHIDTVPNGGHYDGIVGTMAGIEAARTLHEAGVELRHPLEVVVWSNEEGGKTGSRAWMGSVRDEEMALPSLGIRYIGGDPQRLAEVAKAPGDVAGYIELHVEQGAVLDRGKIDIGVVEGIVAIRRWYATVDGFANHAGTTPMDQRQDALYAAALIVADIRRIITSEPGRQVGTVGRIAAEPGAPNVIPGRATFSLEIRDLDMDKVGRLFDRIRETADHIAATNDVEVRFEQYYESPAAVTDERIKNIVRNSATTLGLSNIDMPSGAGHDAQSLKDIAPLGMIFVPSRDGVSHAPSEFTSPEQVTNGANVLLHTLIGMDAALDN